MAEVRERIISHEEASELVKRMLDKGTSNYLIREVLMDKGLAVHAANEIISNVRRSHLDKKPNILEDNLGFILLILTIAALILYVLLNNLT